MQKKMISLVMTFCILLQLLVVGVSAIEAGPVVLNVSEGYIVISDDGYQQAQDEKALSMNKFTSHTGGYVITGSSVMEDIKANITPAVQIVGGSVDKPIQITLRDVTITRDTKTPDMNNRNAAAIMVGDSLKFESDKPNRSGHVAITLADGTNNTLRSCGGYAGLMLYSVENLTSKTSCSVVIGGNGTLNAFGGHINATNSVGDLLSGGAGIGTGHLLSDTGNNTVTITGGTINATGGRFSAGIGGGGVDVGLKNITITGGTICANGGLQATGIGSGNQSKEKSPCDITISNANVTAVGGANAPGIGSGTLSEGSHTITITSGTVKASGDNGSTGIGSGALSTGSCDINISGGKVTAESGKFSAGIGAGAQSSGVCTINITGGQIIATCSGGGGAGIGAANSGKGQCDINISGGAGDTIVATGTTGGAGIGSANNSSSVCNVTINSGTITATGGSGAGIGLGYKSTGNSTIKILGGIVQATGGDLAAGIGLGDLSQKDCAITISGGDVTATGGIAAAGIGGAYDKGLSQGAKLSLNIDGDTTVVHATGGAADDEGRMYGGAGIGGGAIAASKTQSYTVEAINITNGTITAVGGHSAAGIGGGTDSTCAPITISGKATVTATGGMLSSGIGRGNYVQQMVPAVPTLTISKDAVVNAYAMGGYNSTSKKYPDGENFQAIDLGITTLNPTNQNESTHILMGLFEDTANEEKTVKLIRNGQQHLLTLPQGYQSFASTVAADDWKVGVDGAYYSGGAEQNAPDAAQTTVFNTANTPITAVWYLKTATPSLAYYDVTFALGENGRQTAGDVTPLVQVVDANSMATAPKVTANTGYTFTGWSVDGTNIVEPKTMAITENTTFTALYKINSSGGGGDETYYTVTYAPGAYGTLTGSATERVESGYKPRNTPQVNPAPNYMFLGWTMDDTNTIVDPKTVTIRKNTTFTALYDSDGILNKAEHFAYMIGDENGLFNPEKNMTRAEAVVLFSRLLKKSGSTEKSVVDFTDVADGLWYSEAVGTLTSLGIINGYPDDTFRPNQPIARAEFAAIAMRFAAAATGDVTFTDVPADHWAFDYISGAAHYGWINGYPDGSFKPQNNILRAEAVKIVNGMLDRTADQNMVDSNEMQKRFSDVAVSHWAFYHIAEAANGHSYEMKNDTEIWTGLK